MMSLLCLNAVTTSSGDDGYIQIGDSDRWFDDSSSTVKVEKTAADSRIAFFRADINVNDMVDYANINFYGTGAATLDVYYVYRAWFDSEMSYDEGMPEAKMKIGEVTFSGSYSWQSVDITHMARANHVRGLSLFGVRLEGKNIGDPVVTIHSTSNSSGNGFYIEYDNDATWTTPAGAPHYVDAVSGNDTNDGLSPATAWKTLDHINNNVILNPGDSLLFKAGQEWNGVLIPQGQGKSGNPITIGAYGDIDALGRPAIHGGSNFEIYTINHYEDSVHEWMSHIPTVFLYQFEHVTVRDLEITNYDYLLEGGRPLDGHSQSWEALNEIIAQAEYPQQIGTTKPKRYGILHQLYNYADCDNVHFYNLEVHGVNGNLDYRNSSGIMCQTEGVGDYQNLILEGCYIHDVDRQGFQTKMEHLDREWNFPQPGDNWVGSTVKIRRNVFENIGGNSVAVRGTKVGTVAEYNLFDHSAIKHTGNAIYPYNCDDFLMQYNEGRYTKQNINDDDQAAFDLDYKCNRSIMQYNYSHDNDAGLLVTGGTSNTAWQADAVVRYNLFERDGQYRVQGTDNWCLKLSGRVWNTLIYNNTVYVDDHNCEIIYHKNWDEDQPDLTYYFNNILYVAEGTTGVWFNIAESDNNTFSNNFISAEIAGIPTNTNGISFTGNPGFANPGTGPAGYKLAWNSPLRGGSAGSLPLGAEYPSTDFYGRNMDGNTSFDIGMHQVDAKRVKRYVIFTPHTAPPLGLTVAGGSIQPGVAGVEFADVLIYGKVPGVNDIVTVSGDPRVEVVQGNKLKLVDGVSVEGEPSLVFTVNVVTEFFGNVVPYSQDIIFDVGHERVTATDDTYVRSGSSGSNYGGLSQLYIKNSTTDSFDRDGLLQFSLESIPVDTATLNIYAEDAQDSSGSTLGVYKLSTDSWDESTVTWSNAPNFGTRIGTLPYEEYSWVSSDVTGAASTDGILSVGIHRDVEDAQARYFTSKEGGIAPYLDIIYEYSLPPHDSYVSSGAATDNFGGSPDLLVEYNQHESHLRVDFSDYPGQPGSFGSFEEAILYLYAESTESAMNVGIYKVSNESWDESTITWNSASGYTITQPAMDEKPIGSEPMWYGFNIGSALFAESDGDLSLVLKAEPGLGTVTIKSEESDLRPYLFFVPNAGPVPSTMSFDIAPVATGPDSITMTATTATDVSGVEYYFDCLTAGGNDSGWQSSPVYTDTGLNPDTQYSYRVKARDLSVNQNESVYSGTASATTEAQSDPVVAWVDSFPGGAGLPAQDKTGTADPDGDGMNNEYEYLFGQDPTSAGNSRAPEVSDNFGNPSISYTRQPAESYVVMTSTNLSEWSPASVSQVSLTPNPDGTETIVYNSNISFSTQPRQFFRIEAN